MSTAVASPASPNSDEILEVLGQMTLTEFAEFSYKLLKSFQARCEQCRASEHEVCEVHDYLILRPRHGFSVP